MGKHILIVGIAAAIALLVLVLAGRDAGPPATDVGPEPGWREPAPPQLEASGKPQRVHDLAPGPEAPGSVPPAEPERAVEASGIRVRLAGRVLDPQGGPVPDVPIRVYAYFDGTAKEVPRYAEGRADTSGRFVLDFRPDAKVTNKDPWLRMRVVAYHPVWVMAIVNAYVNTREVGEEGYAREDLVLRMQPAFRMVCRVRDVDGRPVAGASCALEQFYGRKRWVDGRDVMAVTDDEGVARLTLPRLDDGVILLRLHGHNAFRVSAPGYATVYARVHVPGKVTQDYVSETDVVLPVPLEIRGSLVDDTGTALADTELSVTGTRKGEWGALVASRWAGHALRTDADGDFLIAAVPPGTWRLEFQVEGCLETRLEVEAGARDLRVRMVRQAVMTLLFRDTRTGRFLGVQGYDIDYESGGSSSTSGGPAEPRVELDDLPPGRHELRVTFAGRAQPFSTTLVARPGKSEPVIFDVPPAATGQTVAGVVEDREGEPLKRVRMSLDPPRSAQDGQRKALEWQTPEDGTFLFEGLPPGRYRLQLDANGFAQKRLTIDVVEGQDPKPLRVVLTQGATLRVVFPPVPPEAGWTYDVRVLHASGMEVDGRFMGEDEPDAAVFPHQPPGEALVTLESSQFRSRRFEGDPYTRRVVLEDGRESVVSFTDVRSVTVRGRVVGKDGRAGGVGHLQLRRIGPAFPLDEVRTTMWYGSKRATVDETGAFSFGGLIPGRYAVANLQRAGAPLTFEVPDAPVQDLVLTCDR